MNSVHNMNTKDLYQFIQLNKNKFMMLKKDFNAKYFYFLSLYIFIYEEIPFTHGYITGTIKEKNIVKKYNLMGFSEKLIKNHFEIPKMNFKKINTIFNNLIEDNLIIHYMYKELPIIYVSDNLKDFNSYVNFYNPDKCNIEYITDTDIYNFELSLVKTFAIPSLFLSEFKLQKKIKKKF